MGLVDSITSQDSIALDTNILIYAHNQSKNYGVKAVNLLDRIQKVKPKVFISVILFEEFLVQIYKKKLEKDLAGYQDFITGSGLFTVVDVNREIATRAAEIRAHYNISAPDAIHLASALESGAIIFVTADKRIPRKIDNLSIKFLD